MTLRGLLVTPKWCIVQSFHWIVGWWPLPSQYSCVTCLKGFYSEIAILNMLLASGFLLMSNVSMRTSVIWCSRPMVGEVVGYGTGHMQVAQVQFVFHLVVTDKWKITKSMCCCWSVITCKFWHDIAAAGVYRWSLMTQDT